MKPCVGLLLLLVVVPAWGQNLQTTPAQTTSLPQSVKPMASPLEKNLYTNQPFDRVLSLLEAIPQRWRSIREPLIPISGRSLDDVIATSSEEQMQKALAWIDQLAQTPSAERPALLQAEISNRTHTEVDLWWPSIIVAKLQNSNLEQETLVVEAWLQWAEALGRRDGLLLAAGFGLDLAELRPPSERVRIIAKEWTTLSLPNGGEIGKAKIGNSYATLLFRLNENQKALDAYRNARALFQAVDNLSGQANAFLGEADVLFRLGENQQALDAYKQARSFFQAAGDKNGQGNSLKGEADILFFLGENQRALDLYRAARILFQSVDNQRGQGNTFLGEANVLLLLGEGQKALATYRNARVFFQAVGDIRGEGRSFKGEADVLFQLGEGQKALEAYRNSRALFEVVGDQNGQGNAWLGEGKLLFNLGNLQKTLDAYQEAGALFQAVGSKLGQANTLFLQATALTQLGENKRALATYGDALVLYKAINDRLGQGNAVYGMADIFFQIGETQKAIEAYLTARRLYQAVGAPLDQANTFRGEADVLLQLGKPQEALKAYRTARTIFHSVGDPFGQGNSLKGEAEVLLRLGENQKALDAYRNARTFFQTGRDKLGEGITFEGEAQVLTLLGETLKALDAYRTARNLYQTVDSKLGQGNTFLGEGDIYYLLSENQKALAAYKNSRDLFQAVDSKVGEGNSFLGESQVLIRLGENQKALAAYRSARVLFQASSDQLGQGNTLIGEAELFVILGENQKALNAYKEARDLFQAAEDPLHQGNTFKGEADVLFLIGEYQKALDAYRKARTFYQAVGNQIGQGNTFRGEADAFASLGESQKALAYYRKARAFFQAVQDSQGEGNAFLGEAKTLAAQGQNRKALIAAAKAAEKYQKSGMGNGQISALLVKAQAEEQTGQEEAAARSATEVIRLHAEERKKQITDWHRVDSDEPVSLAYDILIPQKARQDGQKAEALRLAEEARSRVLLDLLATGPDREERSQGVELQAESTRLTTALAEREEMLAHTSEPQKRLDIESERRILLRDLEWNRYRRLASLDNPFPEAKPLTAIEIQQLSQETGSILLYYVARNEVWGFLILPGQPDFKVRKIELSRVQLRERVRSLTYDLSNSLYELRAREGARALWDHLIAPFAPDLPSGSPLAIVPHGPLHELPFEALLDPEGKPLFEHWPLAITPSASALSYSRKRHHPMLPQDSFLAFSSGRGLNLPVEEIGEISSFFGSNKASFQPTEARFNTYKDLIAKARHVLIATRGIHVQGSRIETYLEIEPTSEVHDSHLTSAEIASIRLDAELVTLAACDTSHGAPLLSDERLDLTRAFLIAGAAAVLATRWKVPEEATTSQFIADFYQAYRKGGPEGLGMRKDEALNEARRLSRERNGPSQVWAAWTLVGDGR